MNDLERKQLSALTARGTDWLLDEAHALARKVICDKRGLRTIGTVSIGVAVDDNGNHSATADSEWVTTFDNSSTRLADSSAEYDVADTRTEALALLVMVLREKAAQAGVSVRPHRAKGG